MSTDPQAAETVGTRNQYDLIAEILARFDLSTIIQQLGEINMALQDIKAQLEANNAVIAEVAGDVGELKASNEELKMKIEELQAQLPDNALVAEIAAIVASQSENLASIAAVVPEPSPEPEPTPEA
jgi:chromosome segregation ATPase